VAIAAGTSDALAAVPGYNIKVAAALGTAEQNAFVGAVKVLFLTTVSFGCLGIIAACFTRSIDHLMIDKVIQKLHNRNHKIISEAAAAEKAATGGVV
jgi:hypothetical protein